MMDQLWDRLKSPPSEVLTFHVKWTGCTTFGSTYNCESYTNWRSVVGSLCRVIKLQSPKVGYIGLSCGCLQHWTIIDKRRQTWVQVHLLSPSPHPTFEKPYLIRTRCLTWSGNVWYVIWKLHFHTDNDFSVWTICESHDDMRHVEDRSWEKERDSKIFYDLWLVTFLNDIKFNYFWIDHIYLMYVQTRHYNTRSSSF